MCGLKTPKVHAFIFIEKLTMFSIEDSNTVDVINLNLTSFSEVGHTHEISDVDNHPHSDQ